MPERRRFRALCRAITFIAAVMVAGGVAAAPAAAASTTFRRPFVDPVVAHQGCTEKGPCTSTADSATGTLTGTANTSAVELRAESKSGFTVVLERAKAGTARLFATVDIRSIQHTSGYGNAYGVVHLIIKQEGWSYFPTAECSRRTGQCEIAVSVNLAAGTLTFGVEAVAHAEHGAIGGCVDPCPSASLDVQVLRFGVK